MKEILTTVFIAAMMLLISCGGSPKKPAVDPATLSGAEVACCQACESCTCATDSTKCASFNLETGVCGNQACCQDSVKCANNEQVCDAACKSACEAGDTSKCACNKEKCAKGAESKKAE